MNSSKDVTIVFADVFGYSALMEDAEEETHRITSHAIDKMVAVAREYGGILRQVQGDGVMLEFATVVSGVMFAIDVQTLFAMEDLALYNGERIAFRIALHHGPVIRQGDQIRGNAVNLAARLEQFAQPGGIVISEQALASVNEADREEFAVEELGTKNLKNVLQPVCVFRIDRERTARRSRLGVVAKQTHNFRNLDQPPSVVVCPLQNLAGQDSSLMGVSIIDELSHQLTKRRQFIVHSPRLFADDLRRMDMFARLSRMHGVEYMIDGKLYERGAQIIASFSVIHTVSARLLQTAQIKIRPDTFLDDIVVGVLQLTMKVESAITAMEFEKSRLSSQSSGIYGEFLNGQHLAHQLNEDANRRAIDILSRIVENNDTFSPAYVELAFAQHMAWRYGWGNDASNELANSMITSKRAINIDPENAQSYGELAYALLFKDGIESGLNVFETANRVNPNDPWILAKWADGEIMAGNADRAIELLHRSLSINTGKHNDWRYWSLGEAHFYSGRFEQCVEAIGQMADSTEGNRLAAASYGLLGKREQAQPYVKKILQNQPDFKVSQWVKKVENDEMARTFSEGLSRAGLA